MTDKEVKRLSRIELLEIVQMLQKKQEQLEKENEELKTQLYAQKEFFNKSPTYRDMSNALDAAVENLKNTAEQYQLLLEKKIVELDGYIQACKNPKE